ncbi:lipocalin family protein [uncultured Algoriphagus sp.]|uniref:lipocalin family protein n=1 Tax=uncultured Algoriphagus sp. TaxID=417365 RepID=UPI0030EEF6B2|tara:strand:+ start:35302 stop:35760 length:459 start_codon:yes stop_codon:yes gene_type:complete
MKVSLFYLCIVSFLLFSCDKEEGKPDQSLVGTWEAVYKNSEYDRVETIQINADGTIIGTGTVRENGSSVDLGYTSEVEGTYKIEGSKLSVTLKKAAYLNDPDITYTTKDKLNLVQGFERVDEYLISDDFSKFYFSCPPNANCIPPQPYKKIK